MTALLLIALTFYLALGLAWTVAVAVARLLADRRQDWIGFVAQMVLWPWAFWLFLRGGE
jgi:hypothetical protein